MNFKTAKERKERHVSVEDVAQILLERHIDIESVVVVGIRSDREIDVMASMNNKLELMGALDIAKDALINHEWRN